MKKRALHHQRVLRGLVWLSLAIFLPSVGIHAQTAGEKTFSSSDDAINEFMRAIRVGDTSRLEAILGQGSDSIVSSGDPVADSTARAHFFARYNEKRSLTAVGGDAYTLNVGYDDWPLPIPLRENSGKWYFDGPAGREEILFRRIGRNELAAIDVCKGIVAAQRDYAKTSHDGKPTGTYAQHIMSSPGTHNGIYWVTQPSEPPSPAGSLLADASDEGYNVSGQHTPYHGYYYRMIARPGGFAVIAYPAEYRSSGVMTFVATQKGAVYQKDLGENSTDIARQMEHPVIDSSWKRVKK